MIIFVNVNNFLFNFFFLGFYLKAGFPMKVADLDYEQKPFGSCSSNSVFADLLL